MLSKIQEPIQEELATFESIFRSSLECDIEVVNKMSSHLLKMQGKQMRPLFLLLTAAMLGGVTKKCFSAATAIELVHTASLVHDDVVDEAYMRRGKWTLNAMYRSKAAVLGGDYVLARALKIAAQSQIYEVIDTMAQVIEEMTEGELMQSDFSKKLNIDVDQYFAVIKRKTAFLLAACGSAGASCSGAAQKDIDNMFKFGELLGVAFQIQDDILDYTNKSITGKISCNDLKEQKLTLPILLLLEKSSEEKKSEILAMVRKCGENNKILTTLRNMVIDGGGVQESENKMEELKQEALSLLERYPSSPYKTALQQYAEFVLKRKK